ncbi:hypothetical protein VTK73DRAFT_3641 [Phialemonium thermophilum]|uniref:Uncharacterized protein n=1 Tax=Phialemonium thermophilum TaxID=223376 RepID=A0ABR3VIZ4_9PEZI
MACALAPKSPYAKKRRTSGFLIQPNPSPHNNPSRPSIHLPTRATHRIDDGCFLSVATYHHTRRWHLLPWLRPSRFSLPPCALPRAGSSRDGTSTSKAACLSLALGPTRDLHGRLGASERVFLSATIRRQRSLPPDPAAVFVLRVCGSRLLVSGPFLSADRGHHNLLAYRLALACSGFRVTAPICATRD